MSTNKDASKKVTSVSKEKISSKTSLSKRESSTDRTNTKKKKESQKTKTQETALSSSLTKISEENVKPKKSSISTKLSSKSEKAPPTTSTKVSLKQENISSNSSKRVTSKAAKVSSSTSTKALSKAENTSLTSTRTQDTTKSTSKTKSLSKKGLNNSEGPLTPSSSRIKKTQYFPSKNLFSNALKSTDIQEKLIKENINISDNKDKATPRKPTKAVKVKNNTSSNVHKADLIDSSRSIRSTASKIKEPFVQIFSPDTRRKNSRILNAKIKDVATRDSSPDTSSVSERPRTATLRKGSIVNANIVGPEAPKLDNKNPVKEYLQVKENPLSAKQKSPSPTNSDDNYEDDFESYESDFEAYSSSEDSSKLANIPGEVTSSVSSSSEDVSDKKNLSPITLHIDVKRVSSGITDDERSHDSGTFELPEFKHKRILEDIKESVEKENAILKEIKLKEKTNHGSLSDEGFEDQQSLQFINFAYAKKKCELRRASALRKKRGEEILNMIKLDNVNFTIFDSPSVPYEVYISSYGQNNTVQTSVQTGDDNISEEIQTEAVEVQVKWTQMPIKFTSFDQNNENFWINYKNEYLGAGDDSLANSLNKIEDINEKRLKTFLNQSVDIIFDILAEANIRNLDQLQKNGRDIPFSDGYLQFNTAHDIFKNTKVENLSVFSKNINHILTVHLKKEESDDFIRSIVSIWDISDFNAPQTTLVSYGEVCCSTFSLDFSDYIFAGQKDGAILVWNIKEKSKIYDILSRTPTFTTDIGSSHFAKVVSIQPIRDDQEDKGYFAKSENNEICSLDEDGDLIIWNLYTESESKKFTSDIVLINTVKISLKDHYPEMPDLVCSEFILMEKHIFVSTNYGFILHYLINGNRNNVKKFVPATTIDATCLEACPFSPSYFFAGYSNGDITLYSRNTERHLMLLRNNEEITNTSVHMIQWSKTKPFVLYAKDSQNTIHIWDLSKSDMHPDYSIPFKDSINCLKLSPVINVEEQDTSYMLIGTEDGKVYLHLLNKEYGQESYKDYNNHVATFLNYVSRL